MQQMAVTLTNPTGLHARPAARFVQTAQKFSGTRIKLIKDDKEVNAASIMEVLTLGAVQGTTLTIVADGPEEQAAVAALAGLIRTGFGEA